MSIKSDKWIRRMALEKEMISPFEPDHVREIDNRRVISFGTSSYGYDIRISDEFQVFAPRVDELGFVDPKNFDENLLRYQLS